jgi:DNA-binding NarL/FixJ family response regulator
MNATSPIRVLLVDDHTLFRESLRRLLEEDTDYMVVAEVATVADALELCRNGASFDLALVDYDLGPTAGARNGVSVLRCLRERKEFIPALMIAAQIEPQDLLTVAADRGLSKGRSRGRSAACASQDNAARGLDIVGPGIGSLRGCCCRATQAE